jgi:hypothetical protein
MLCGAVEAEEAFSRCRYVMAVFSIEKPSVELLPLEEEQINAPQVTSCACKIVLLNYVPKLLCRTLEWLTICVLEWYRC